MPLSERSFTARLDPEGYWLDASPECQFVTGYPPDELVGTSAYDLFHPEDVIQTLEEHRALLEGVRALGMAPGFNTRLRRKDGSYVWLEIELRVVRDPATGLVTGFEATAADVGHRFAAARAASSRLVGSSRTGRGIASRSE